MDFLKTIGGKIVGGLVGIVVIAAGIAAWRMDPATRNAMLSGTGKSLGWFALILAVPWATFFLTTWVARFEKNLAGAALVVGYSLIEAVLLAWLFDWSIAGATAWIFYAAAVLIALVYNVLICDWIAERFGS